MKELLGASIFLGLGGWIPLFLLVHIIICDIAIIMLCVRLRKLRESVDFRLDHIIFNIKPKN